MSREPEDRARHDADALHPDQGGTGADTEGLLPAAEPEDTPRATPAGPPPDEPAVQGQTGARDSGESG